jgi:hypothetical protein
MDRRLQSLIFSAQVPKQGKGTDEGNTETDQDKQLLSPIGVQSSVEWKVNLD